MLLCVKIIMLSLYWKGEIWLNTSTNIHNNFIIKNEMKNIIICIFLSTSALSKRFPFIFNKIGMSYFLFGLAQLNVFLFSNFKLNYEWRFGLRKKWFWWSFCRWRVFNRWRQIPKPYNPNPNTLTPQCLNTQTPETNTETRQTINPNTSHTKVWSRLVPL